MFFRDPNADTANDQRLKETELIYFKPKQKVKPNQKYKKTNWNKKLHQNADKTWIDKNNQRLETRTGNGTSGCDGKDLTVTMREQRA